MFADGTDRLVQGNLVAAGLDAQSMQHIARWLNLSETTFVTQRYAGAAVRVGTQKVVRGADCEPFELDSRFVNNPGADSLPARCRMPEWAGRATRAAFGETGALQCLLELQPRG